MAIETLAYKLVMDHRQFVQGSIASRRELTAAKQLMLETSTPAEQLQASLDSLGGILRKGAIDQQTYDRAAEKLSASFRRQRRDIDASEAGFRDMADAERRAMDVTRSLESATDRYDRELRELNSLLKLGAINQQTYAAAAERSRAALIGTTSATMGLGATLSRVGGGVAALTGVSLGIVGVGNAARNMVASSREFEQQFSSSLAIMGDVSEDLRQRMRDVAQDVAFQTQASASEAAEAYFFLASAGLDAEAAVAALPTTARFAQAGMFDLATATDLATDAQSALGLTVRDDAIENLANMVRVTDVLVKANTLSNATVEQFSTSLTNKAGPALRSVGKTIEEGVAVLAAFADQGVKGEEAGTALSIVMRDLATQAYKNADAFLDANVNVFDASGEMRDMADIVADLEDRLSGLSDLARKQVLLDLGFADKSLAFTTALIGTSDLIRDYHKQLLEAGGTTREVADKQIPPLEQAINDLKAGFDEFSQIVMPPLAEGFLDSEGRPLEQSVREFNAEMRRGLPLLRSLGAQARGAADDVAGLANAIGPLTKAMETLSPGTATGLGEMTGEAGGAFRAFALGPLAVLGRLLNVTQRLQPELQMATVDAEKMAVAMQRHNQIFGQASDVQREYQDALDDTADTVTDSISSFDDQTAAITRQAMELQFSQEFLARIAGQTEDQIRARKDAEESLAIQQAIASRRDLNAELAREIDNLRLGADAAADYAASHAGVPRSLIDTTEALRDELEALREHEHLMDRGKAIADEFATPFERLSSRVEDLSRLLAVGAIDGETFWRATEGAIDDATRAMERNRTSALNTAELAGSAEAIARLARREMFETDPIPAAEDDARAIAETVTISTVLEAPDDSPIRAALDGFLFRPEIDMSVIDALRDELSRVVLTPIIELPDSGPGRDLAAVPPIEPASVEVRPEVTIERDSDDGQQLQELRRIRGYAKELASKPTLTVNEVSI